ncbi:glutamate racemase [Caenimonas soli]|uniref:glutamate racemase n=1 Tax=Caenimonas soli TaxID=2735555 RepID=UPI00155584FC|nr:glutamate racemase [Caenimonas soli]NPC57512.1 glutamate racemase [Caenimonas soli]
MKPIGVFDSGVGGLSILKALRAALPGEDFVYLADTRHAPYGERGDDYVADRSRAIFRQLIEEHAVKSMVVACNTATAAAIHLLRRDYPGLPLVGVEPALKPAVARSRTKRIGVLATRGTLQSAKFGALHDSLKEQAEFVLQPCDGLAAAIEADDLEQVDALCAKYIRAIGEYGSAPGQVDTLVLGCTHYPFAQAQLLAHAGPGVTLIETGEPVARQTHRLLEAAGLLEAQDQGRVELLTTGSPAALQAAASRWLGL